MTRGAIDTLSRDELEAILAYEVSRIGSWDVALSSWTVALTERRHVGGSTTACRSVHRLAPVPGVASAAAMGAARLGGRP